MALCLLQSLAWQSAREGQASFCFFRRGQHVHQMIPKVETPSAVQLTHFSWHRDRWGASGHFSAR